MSTRRARIKAVAALPQRRKNVGNAVIKTKQEQTKELAENLLKSPKASRTAVDKHSGSSPARVSLSPRLLSPRKSPRAPVTPDIEKVASDWKVPTTTQISSERRSNTAFREKTDTNKPTTSQTDVFVSPQARASPLRKRSPVVKTPSFEIEITTERVSNRRLLDLQEVAQKHTRVSENRENILSPKADNIAGNRNGGVKTIGDGNLEQFLFLFYHKFKKKGRSIFIYSFFECCISSEFDGSYLKCRDASIETLLREYYNLFGN